ncbi:MAG: hypothetical protein J2P48_07815 [Alphaproteobacteria bacterium]|nr:hypothetical protein [Alphaproteobacteria bacterium]
MAAVSLGRGLRRTTCAAVEPLIDQVVLLETRLFGRTAGPAAMTRREAEEAGLSERHT